MYCINCATQLPDEASFCWKCGKPQKAAVQAQTDETRWETCEIMLVTKSKLLTYNFQFWGRAIGPKGEYDAGRTEWVSALDTGNKVLAAHHHRLVGKLAAGGWEPTGRGTEWWNDKFRRRVK